MSKQKMCLNCLVNYSVTIIIVDIAPQSLFSTTVYTVHPQLIKNTKYSSIRNLSYSPCNIIFNKSHFLCIFSAIAGDL